jgi:nitrite reductase/ring-hydroxylating ferredoxin subunit
MDEQRGQPASKSRRGFLRLSSIGVGLAAVIGAQLWLLLKLFRTPPSPERLAREIAVGPVARFAVGSVTHFWKEHFILMRQTTGFLALSHQCTHQKCNVDYVPDQGVIVCPCHGSQFDLTGTVLKGPAPRPLPHFATSVRDGTLIVDTRRVLPSRPS